MEENYTQEELIHQQVLKCCEALADSEWNYNAFKQFYFLRNILSTQDNFDTICIMIEMLVADMLNPIASNYRMQEVYKQMFMKYYDDVTDYSKFVVLPKEA